MRFIPHDYQSYVIGEMLRKPRIAVMMEMGLGRKDRMYPICD